MSRFSPVCRRRFLALASATSAALAMPATALPGPAAQRAPGAGLALAFKHPASAIAIGRRYLERFPDDREHEVLAAVRDLAGETDPAAVRSVLQARIKRDFARGDTVMLDGWILSRSECQACAALALTAGAADRRPGA